MFSELNKIEFGSEIKSRRAVVTFSFLLIFFKNLVLKSDELIFLGLKVEVSQESVVAILKLFLLLALLAYFLSALEGLPRRVVRFMRRRDDAWWTPISEEISEFFEQSSPNYEYRQHQKKAFEENPEWDDAMYMEKASRKKKRQKVAGYYRPITAVTRMVSYVLWPLSLAYIAFFCPEAIFVFR